MTWLNYHHLLYFWTVARTGSIAAASQELHVSRPTISAQLKQLEASLGHELFRRRGRGLVLTDVGRTTFRYADEIFRVGRELQQALQGHPVGRRLRFTVGVAQMIPKLVAKRLLEPAFSAVDDLTLECRESDVQELLASLAVHELDVVISDAPATRETAVKVYNHLLGETGVTFFASEKWASLRDDFPRSLDGAPALLPSRGAQLRRQLEDWFQAQDVRPVIAGEFDDSALLTAFGQDGMGFFVAPTAIEEPIMHRYDVIPLARTDDVRERFYAISAERQLRHPAVAAIAESARTELFVRR